MGPLNGRRLGWASLSLALGMTISAEPATAQTWPMQNDSHDVLHSFQNPFFFFSYFHEGVDIRGWNDNVVAMRGGTVRYVNQGDSGGTLLVEVDTGVGIEADSYLHIRIGPWSVGDVIQEGDFVGQVSTSYFGQNNQHHVHVNRFDGWAGGSGYVSGRTNMLHPLEIFPNGDDRDPQALDAVPFDANEDGVVFELVKAGDNDVKFPFAFKKIDLLLEATDRKSDTLYWNQGLTSVGYWVESHSGGADIRDAAAPYRLVRFDDAWRGSVADADRLVTIALVSDADHVVEFGSDDTFWSSLATYRLTNTTGTTGGADRLDEAQFWRTNARVGTALEPNGWDGQVAREIAEAQFPDGIHVVHALTEDLRGEHWTDFPIVVDNFRPYVKQVTASELGSGGLYYRGTWAFDAVTALLDFTLEVPPVLPSATGTQGMHLEIVFSEPVARARLTGLEPSLGGLPSLTSAQPVGQQTVWTGEIPAEWFGRRGLPPSDGLRLFIEAEDLNGSTLYEFADTASVPAPFNRRSNPDLWDDATTDALHVIPIDGL